MNPIAWFWIMGIVLNALLSCELERRKPDGHYSIGIAMALSPVMWFMWPFLLIDTAGELHKMRGQEQLKAAKARRALTKKWDAYYTYLGEVETLGDDYDHPGPAVLEPRERDPRGTRDDYPKPDLATVLRLYRNAESKAKVKQHEVDLAMQEYELLGMKDTDEFIRRVDNELEPPRPTKREPRQVVYYNSDFWDRRKHDRNKMEWRTR